MCTHATHVPCVIALAGALWHKEGSGRIAVLGSVQMFDDKFIDKEENSKLVDFIFKWLKPVRSGVHAPWLSMALCAEEGGVGVFVEECAVAL